MLPSSAPIKMAGQCLHITLHSSLIRLPPKSDKWNPKNKFCLLLLPQVAGARIPPLPGLSAALPGLCDAVTPRSHVLRRPAPALAPPHPRQAQGSNIRYYIQHLHPTLQHITPWTPGSHSFGLTSDVTTCLQGFLFADKY